MRPKRPTILSVERKYEGDRISLRVETAKFDDGPKFDREIVEHPGSVVLVPSQMLVRFCSSGNFVKQRESFIRGFAGTIEPGEAQR
ncbi:MAG: hypothetical protein CM1200mP39_16460 [Dehalococcoidia bacterium]|nr:MAG: hypothetical protein CM1200mP39_16460 [Dehalococcoidia bacterium]